MLAARSDEITTCPKPPWASGYERPCDCTWSVEYPILVSKLSKFGDPATERVEVGETDENAGSF